MAAGTTTWITVTRWDDFQHYSKRDPIWVKVYTRLLSDDRYLSLTFHQRGVLQGIWLEYARANRQLRGSTLSLSRQLGGRVTTRDLEALNDAGFIDILASSPLAARYQLASPEREAEKEKSLPSSNGYVDGQAGDGNQIEQARIDPLAELRRLSGAA